MSADELRTRLTQLANKRLDALAYQLGHDFSAGEMSPGATGKFFFAGDEIGDRIALLKKFLPDQAAQIQSEADSICQHRFNLLGYTEVDYGKEIDWHLDAVHGKRAPLKPWYKINFLDFNEVGDHKVTWELNRHQHMVTLAKAWALARDPRYVSELVEQWYGWKRANPYPIGINWGSSLEVAFRSLSWIWVANLLDDTAPVPAEFRRDLARALSVNARYIEKYLSTYFSPNTHLLGEAVALFFIGTLHPDLPRAGQWKDRGWHIILQAAERQVRPDGVYFEQALHYHVYALDFFLHARLLAAQNGMEVPAGLDAVLEKMLDVIKSLSQAGPPEGFGDDDGGRVFNPRRNQTEHMTDPLAIGAALGGRECIQAAAGLTEEAIWVLGSQAIESVKKQPRGPVRSCAFASGGVYVMAGAAPCPHQFVVDAGPQGIGRCGHGHADALSIRMAIDGRRFLIDPGTCVYISDSNDRDEFRGTAAHNTVRINEQDQAVASGPFAWDGIPVTQIEHWARGESFDFLCASHNGYSRLANPVIHHRFVFRGPEGVCLVRDICQGKGRHLVESFWHFAEDVHVGSEGGALLATREDTASHLLLLSAGTGDWQIESVSGFVSPAYGLKKPAPVARISASVNLPAECAVLMCASAAAQPSGQFVCSREEQTRNVQAYEFTVANTVHKFFFAQGESDWTAGDWTSDARFLYSVTSHSSNKGDALVRVILVDGTFVKRRGASLVAQERRLEKWEWALEDRNPSSHNSALEFAGR